MWPLSLLSGFYSYFKQRTAFSAPPFIQYNSKIYLDYPMHELGERELFEAIHYAKSIDEETGAKIIEHFQLEQTALAQTILLDVQVFLA
jgi:hypothetical protein